MLHRLALALVPADQPHNVRLPDSLGVEKNKLAALVLGEDVGLLLGPGHLQAGLASVQPPVQLQLLQPRQGLPAPAASSRAPEA